MAIQAIVIMTRFRKIFVPLPVILFLITHICIADDWIYTGSSKEFIPVSSELGGDWTRSLIRTVNDTNEFKNFFQATHEADSGITTSYEVFRRKSKVRELSDVEFYIESETVEKQTYQLVVLLFESREYLTEYWNMIYEQNLDSPIFTTVIDEHDCCIFRLQNVYVRVSTNDGSPASCERIAGVVFNTIQYERNKAHPVGSDSS